ncbi:MAG: serine hydrolase [Acidobacteriota bacterium]
MQTFKPHPVVMTLALVVTVLVGAIARPALATDVSQSNVKRELEAYFDDFFESEPSWGGTLVAKDGGILFEKSYGWADHSQARPNTRKTVFRIQSLSKTFTAIATLMLVERGRLALNDRVIDYVPELVEGEEVTIRHLLRMESGIFNFTDNPTTWQDSERFRYPEELLELFVDYPLNFEPGTQFEYSNSNFVLLGLIIERVTGKTYGQFLNRRIFRPLKMRRSRFDPWDLAFARIRAVGYEDISQDPPILAAYYPPYLAYAAGGILSTARDLLKYDQALYGERLLSQETLERAFTPGPAGYGLGWVIGYVPVRGERHKLVWHSGGGPGFRSLLMRMVDARVTLVLVFNTTGEDVAGDKVMSERKRWIQYRKVIKRLGEDVGEIVLGSSE